ncbi:MAG: hypothetical protein QXP99_04560 [Thermoproteota archaeon]
MSSQKLISDIYGNSLEGDWRSFPVRVGKHRIVNFGRVETENVAMLRSLVGDGGFIAMRVKDHEVIRRLNLERKGSYQFMMPEYVGDLKPGEKITVWVRPVSRREFIEKAVENLPFGLKLELESEDMGMLSIMDAISIPVRVARFEWSEGNNSLEIDLEFNGNGEKHILAVAVKGDEKKATIRFRRTSGTIHSIRLCETLNQIVIRYHDFKGRYFDHYVILNDAVTSDRELFEQRDRIKTRLLSREEIDQIRKWIENNERAKYGNKIRNLIIEMVRQRGEIAGRKIKTDLNSIFREVEIIRKYSNRRELLGKVDVVFESEDEKLIVVEVKASIKKLGEQYETAWKQFKGNQRDKKSGYIRLIKNYGLTLGEEVRNDVEAYIIVVAKVDLENGLLSIKKIKEVSED